MLCQKGKQDLSNHNYNEFGHELGGFISDDDDELHAEHNIAVPQIVENRIVPPIAENQSIIGEHYVNIDARNIIEARTRSGGVIV